MYKISNSPEHHRDAAKSVPPEALMSEFRFPDSEYSRWNVSWRPFKKTTIKLLADNNIFTAFDVAERTGKFKDLFPNSPILRARLDKIARLVDGNYRGKGFPWEVDVRVLMPRNSIDALKSMPRKEVEQAVTDYIAEKIQSSTFVDDLVAMAKARKRSELEAKIAKLQEELNANG